MDQNRQVFDLFERLCRELAGPHYDKEIFQSIVTRTSALEPNFISGPVLEEESTLLANINTVLARHYTAAGATVTAARDQEQRITAFASAYEQLSNEVTLPFRKSLLLFLYLLSDSGSRRLPPPLATHRRPRHFTNNSTSTQGGGGGTARDTDSDSSSTKSASVAELVRNFSGRTTTVTDAGGGRTVMATAKVPPHYQISPPRVQGAALNGSMQQLNNSSSPNTFVCGLDHMDELVHDVIYSFMGAQGKYLRKDIRGFYLDPTRARQLSHNDAQMMLKLAELGHLHDQILEFTSADSGKQPSGLFGQGLVTAIQNEMTQYYGMVACLQEQVNRAKEEGKGDGERITLVKIMLWVIQPLHRFQCIHSIATACQDKRGGAIASAIFGFLHNGDAKVKAITKQLLRSVCVPLVHMLSRWLLDGEIEDPHGEFFIESLSEIHSDRLWHDKYRVREALLPSFISLDLARRILLIGKSINFLREVCHDKGEIRDKRDLELCLSANADDLFVPFEDTRLHAEINKFCTNTSRKVLDQVVVQSSLMDHLHAIRKYLLLGQGDFVGMLMENLREELDRPAKEIQSYTLSAILDSTIRQSSSAAIDEQCLNNLNVTLLNSFQGDSGWDLFALQYTVAGPLVTMLEPAMAKYKVIFKPLWRGKHIEQVLTSKIWKMQVCQEKLLRKQMGRDLNGITRPLNLLTAQMIHFINEIQYYILFEVIECEWVGLCKCIEQAESIDDILRSHHAFLEAVRTRIFLDESGRPLSGTLETIYRTIMNLEGWQDKFYRLCEKEAKARQKWADQVKMSEHLGEFGVTMESKLDQDQRQKVFDANLKQFQMHLNKIAFSYGQCVRQFLILLAESNDYSLQLFVTRIDYNEYYKKNDERLQEPLTYERMRMSSMFHPNKSKLYQSSAAAAAVSHHHSSHHNHSLHTLCPPPPPPHPQLPKKTITMH